MRICIIKPEKDISVRQSLRITRSNEFRTVGIYTASVGWNLPQKRISRRIKRFGEELAGLGISFCAVPGDFVALPLLRQGGIAVFTERELFAKRRAEMALEFAKAHGDEKEIVISGGSSYAAVEAAAVILRKRRQVFLKNAAFDEVAERISHMTGASVRRDLPKDAIELDLAAETDFLRCGNLRADYSSFRAAFPEEHFLPDDGKVRAATAAVLEICGVLRKNEVKVEYFSG